MIFKKYFYPCLIFIALLILSGCGDNIEGVYVANNNVGDTIKIYPDNKYVRIYYDPNYKLNSKIFTDSGKWKYAGGRIDFYDWLDREESTDLKGKFVFGTDIKKSFFSDDTKIMIDYDRNDYYLKQK